MKIIGITDEDFVNYKLPCMYIGLPYCTFKCDKESGGCYCQNSSLAKSTPIDIPIDHMIKRYIANPITKAICFSGLEPFEQYNELKDFIYALRYKYHCSDTVVIYTGFNKDEISKYLEELSKFENIIVKFGRFVPNEKKHFDDILGVNLASMNQYAERIS